MRRIALVCVVFAGSAVAVSAPPAPEVAPAPRPASLKPLARWGDNRLRHPNGVESLAFDPAGKVLATTAHAEADVWLWDVATARPLARFHIPDADVGAPAKAVGFTHAGRLLVGRGPDALFLNADTGRVLFRIDGVSDFDLSPDGKLIAGRADGKLTLWSADTGRKVRELGEVGRDWWVTARFSPDGKRVAAYWQKDHNITLTVAPTAGSKPLATVATGPTRGGETFQAVWAGSDRLVVTWADDIVVHDLTTGKRLASKPRTADNPKFGPSGETRWLVSAHSTADGRLFVRFRPKAELIELDPATLERKPGPKIPTESGDVPVVFSRDGKTLALTRDYSVRLLNAATGKPLHPELEPLPSSSPWFYQFSGDGRRLVTSGLDGIRVWDAEAGKVTASFTQPAELSRVFFSPDGRWIAGAEVFNPGPLVIWNAATGAEVFREKEADEQPNPSVRPGTRIIGFDPDGRLWVMEPRSGELRKIEVPSGKVLAKIAGFRGTEVGRLSGDGHWLAVSGWTAFAIRSTDPALDWQVIEQHERLGDVPAGDSYPCPYPLAISHDGRFLFSRGKDSVLSLWNVTGRPVVVAKRPTPATETPSVHRCFFSPDGRRILMHRHPSEGGDEQAGVLLLETATLGEVLRFDPPNGAPTFSPSPDWRRLVVAHADATMTLWDWTAIETAAHTTLDTRATPEALWEAAGRCEPEGWPGRSPQAGN